ncbi:hypothetical protein TUM4438_35860 [Shewanella sairae]|uniref:Peptidase M16 C-terminal domain-containing protein n=1 Tax=Shewanella sairae TaxID=190310 RepID=A0ABQ4PP17_9GAMM|nr:insulinase family protein [Shewanella sairae]MCL1129733.1 insulinase family protein [Shewanella sairae]GIU50319.1 hypothetical protein TUM4438_35860 [Shewanella sairae]
MPQLNKSLIKPLIKLSFNIAIASLLLSAIGCQQTHIEFTDLTEPSLPAFDQLQGAPTLAPLVITPTNALLSKSLNSELTLYQLHNTLSGLNHLSLVAYSTAPMTNLDVIVQAFTEKKHWLAQQSSLACTESLRIRASMHSLTISIDCPSSAAQASELLMQFWQADSFDQIDIANVRRQLKLAKHINTYSGAEIDHVWAEKILGEQHIYNQALNNSELADELNLSKLNQIRDRIFAQSKWAILTNAQLGQDPQFIATVTQQFESLAFNSQTTTLRLDSKPAKTQTTPLSNSNKTLFIIDAPGSVKTQVRIGYPLDSADQDGNSIQNCQLLASWLGRSFSGRLYYDLREVRGLTYGIYGRCFDNPLSRTLKFYGSTKLEHTGAFIHGVLDHLTLATESQASLNEINALQTYLTSQEMLRQANYRAIEADTIKQLVRGIPLAQKQAEHIRLNQLTASQLQQIAHSVFSKTPYIVIRGDRDKIEADLRQKLPDWELIEAQAN